MSIKSMSIIWECDGCGKEIVAVGGDSNSCLSVLEDAGWKMDGCSGEKVRCPDCRRCPATVSARNLACSLNSGHEGQHRDTSLPGVMISWRAHPAP